MKPSFHPIRLLLAVAVVSAIASFGYAGPGPQYWRAMTEAAQFKKLEAGDKVVFVCYGCKTISEIPVQSAAHAESLGKPGSAVVCPACQQVAKIILRPDPSDGRMVVTYVNAKGEEYAFLARDSHEN